MKTPTAHDLTQIAAIAAVLCVLGLVAAFAGAGITALAVLAIIAGPASILAHRALERRGADQSASRVHPG